MNGWQKEPGEEFGEIDYSESEPGGSGSWDGALDPIEQIEIEQRRLKRLEREKK
jgi:hypothetical protein